MSRRRADGGAVGRLIGGSLLELFEEVGLGVEPGAGDAGDAGQTEPPRSVWRLHSLEG